MTDNQQGAGNRQGLSAEELGILDLQVLPTARRWLSIPGLAEHGRNTLLFWGEYDIRKDPLAPKRFGGEQ